MMEPDPPPTEDNNEDESAPRSRSQLSRRQLVTIAVMAFVIGLAASWIVSRL